MKVSWNISNMFQAAFLLPDIFKVEDIFSEVINSTSRVSSSSEYYNALYVSYISTKSRRAVILLIQSQYLLTRIISTILPKANLPLK